MWLTTTRTLRWFTFHLLMIYCFCGAILFSASLFSIILSSNRFLLGFGCFPNEPWFIRLGTLNYPHHPWAVWQDWSAFLLPPSLGGSPAVQCPPLAVCGQRQMAPVPVSRVREGKWAATRQTTVAPDLPVPCRPGTCRLAPSTANRHCQCVTVLDIAVHWASSLSLPLFGWLREQTWRNQLS